MDAAKIIDSIKADGGTIVEEKAVVFNGINIGQDVVFLNGDNHYFINIGQQEIRIYRCHRRHNDYQADGWTLGHSTATGKTYRVIANFVKRNT